MAFYDELTNTYLPVSKQGFFAGLACKGYAPKQALKRFERFLSFIGEK